MTFTKIFTQLMRRKEQCIGFEFHSTGKNSMKIVKKAVRSNQQGVYSSKRQMSRLKEKKN
jgi:hypothetical protein